MWHLTYTPPTALSTSNDTFGFLLPTRHSRQGPADAFQVEGTLLTNLSIDKVEIKKFPDA